MSKKVLGILIFDEVEVLDFCGPFEVFSITGVLIEDSFEVSLHVTLIALAYSANRLVTLMYICMCTISGRNTSSETSNRCKKWAHRRAKIYYRN